MVCLSGCHTSEPCKTAEPIEMPFGLRTWVGQMDHVLDGDSDPPREQANFGGRMGGDAVLCQTTLTTYVCYGQTWMERSVWMDQHATWYGGRLWPSHTALHWDLDPPKGAQQPPPTFRPMSILAKRQNWGLCPFGEKSWVPI